MLRALLLLPFLATSALHAEAVIEAYGELPADTRDANGDTIGGIGSGLVYDSKGDVYYSVSDRGPGDGTMPYRPRCVVLKIGQDGDKLDISTVKSIIFRDESGREMTGLIPDDPEASTPRMKDGRTCIDPEALALASDGSLYVTDEYGPYLYQFASDGKMIRRIEMPEQFRPVNGAGKKDFTDKAELVSGRNINQGPEGMCLLPDGKTAALIFQSGLMQDGGRESPTTRILLLDLESGNPTGLYVYPFTTELPGNKPVKLKNLSVNDMASLGNNKFLVLERDKFGRDGDADPKPAGYKAVWVADISSATDLLTSKTDELKPVEKRLLFNLPELVKDIKDLTAKWESIAVLPSTDAKTVTLIMGADNDFLTPTIHHNGEQLTFERAKDTVPAQFFKIQAPLPENP